MNYTLHHGDNREVLRTMPDNSVDSIVTDPPYELGFMGKKWDSTGIAYDETLWAECLRVLKPGGHLIAFGGTRTYHRMTCAIEDAGFEIRDCIMWLYGCLDEQTRIVTRHGVKQYNRIKVGDTVLCYNIDKSQYQYEQVQEVVIYDYHDTAYRLIGDFGEQVVSRNHRVIVERNGSEVFVPAEALQSEERIPILENVHTVSSAISNTQSYPAIAQSSLFEKLRQSKTFNHSHWSKEENICQGCGAVRGMRQNNIAVPISNKSSQGNDLQSSVQREITSNGISKTFSQSTSKLDARIRTTITATNDRKNQSVMEGWGDIPESQGNVCESSNQVRALSSGVFVNGTLGRVCDGTSNCGCTNNRATIESHRSGASHQSRRNGQQHQQSDAICEQCRTQNIRISQIHKTTMVRIVPFTYTGKVWCVRVPSGAFVAERNGAYFPTGNSGFPKSHDVSKALDKQAGAEREVVGEKTAGMGSGKTFGMLQTDGENYKAEKQLPITAPATPLAQQWQGWGTALKPAHEPIVVARKPLQGTVADNVTAWGVGALNIDGCRIPSDDGFEKAWDKPVRTNISNGSATFGTGKSAELGTHVVDISANKPTGGRWPANIILDEEAAHMLDEQSGGASRFFYVAKASKAEREAGLDSTCTVKYNIDRSILGGLSWNDVSTATVQLLQKVTSELETLKWHIGESGESITVLYPKDSSFITSMEISKITALKTCNLLMHLLTSESTVDVNYEMEYGSSLAKNAEQLKAWILNITNGKMELARGVVSVASITLQKISESEPNARNNHHSTVKPIALMRYLVRMVTPRGGVVLDPFMGSGTTGCAAMLEAVRFIGIDITPEYKDIAERRIQHWTSQNPMEL